MGIADGAKENWIFLKQYTTRQILDFDHAREYIRKAASAIFGKDQQRKVAWVEDWRSRLKHKQGAASRFIKELESQRTHLDKRNWIERDEEVRMVITYYTTNQNRMCYVYQEKHHLPIGSGGTEAACKTWIKQRMCLSGSRWREAGASCVLALRALKLTKDRWQQFWGYVMRHGCTSF